MCYLHTVPLETTDTCQVMSDIAQFITVFLANVTNQLELTPNCEVIESSCHSIKCSSTDGSRYNVDIFPCTTPPTFQLEVHHSTAVFRHTFTANNRVIKQFNKNTRIQVTMSYEVNLVILEV